MDLNSPSHLRLAMQLAGIKPKKALGQHWLMDSPSLDQIAAAAKLKPTDTVLEIGPGLGSLTGRLTARAAKVVALEADQPLADWLRQNAPANLQVVTADARQFDLRSLTANYKVVANLPYYLTSQILRLLLESPNPPALMVLLIQKEVAERITANPGQLSILALSVQYYAAAKITGYVERQKFYPAPKVDSAILHLDRRNQPIFPADRQKLFRLIKAGFGEKRKQLKNALAGGLNTEASVVQRLLSTAKLPPIARAQELDWAAWERLYEAATKQGLLD